MRKIEKKAEQLKAREKEVRLQLDKSEEKLKKSTKRVGLIALVSGLVALLIYWIYKSIFMSPSSKEIKATEKKVVAKGSILKNLMKLITPYLIEFLTNLLELKKEGHQNK